MDATVQSKIAAFRRIVEQSQAGKVDRCRVDLFSASAVITVYDALSPEAQAKYASMPVVTMVKIAFKLVK